MVGDGDPSEGCDGDNIFKHNLYINVHLDFNHYNDHDFYIMTITMTMALAMTITMIKTMTIDKMGCDSYALDDGNFHEDDSGVPAVR